MDLELGVSRRAIVLGLHLAHDRIAKAISPDISRNCSGSTQKEDRQRGKETAPKAEEGSPSARERAWERGYRGVEGTRRKGSPRAGKSAIGGTNRRKRNGRDKAAYEQLKEECRQLREELRLRDEQREKDRQSDNVREADFEKRDRELKSREAKLESREKDMTGLECKIRRRQGDLDLREVDIEMREEDVKILERAQGPHEDSLYLYRMRLIRMREKCLDLRETGLKYVEESLSRREDRLRADQEDRDDDEDEEEQESYASLPQAVM